MAYTQGDLNERSRSLKQGISKLSADPRGILGANYDPTIASDLGGMQAEYGDVQNLLNQGNIDKTLGLFNQYSPQVDESSDRAAIDDLFKTQQDQKLQALNDMFAQQRGQAIDEAAATGNLRQPGFQAYNLNSIDALKSKAVEQLFAELGIGKNQAILDSNARNRELGFNKARTAAGIMQGGQQFGDELSFNRDKFDTSTGLSKREQDLNDLFRRDELGQRQRMFDDSQPSGFDKNLARAGAAANVFGNVTAGVKNLLGSGGALR